MRGINQGGSLAGFLIIGGLMALVLIGGLYGLNRYNQQQSTEESSLQEEAPTETATTDERDSAQDGAQRTDPTPDDEPETPAATETPQPAAPSTTPAAELPQTGPADTALGILALGSLVFAGTHYIRSRR